MVQADFTLDELLAYLREDDGAGLDGYLTSSEWADRFGVTRRRMLSLLKEAQDADLLLVSRDHRIRIDGQKQLTAVYAFAPQKGNEPDSH